MLTLPSYFHAIYSNGHALINHWISCIPPTVQRTPPPSEEGEVPPYEPGSSSFSGRHDNGLLPPLREGGVWGQVIRAVGGAKDDSDIFLTGEIGGREREEGMEVEESEEPEEGEEGRVEGMKGEGVRAFGNVEDVAKRRVEASSCKDENEGKEAEGEAVWAVTAGRQEGGEGGEGEDQATICGLKKPKV